MAKTKAELVDEVMGKTGMNKAKSKEAVEAVLEGLQDGLQKGYKISLTGFGTFQVKQQKERSGRNPQTGEMIQIPARKVVKFSPGKNLRDAVA